MGLRTLATAALASAFLIGLSPAIARGPESVSDLARELSPAVVNISTSRHVTGGAGVPFPQAPEGSPLNEFFDEHNPNEGLGPQQMDEARSLGSGFIIDADGTIVTNNHVIDGADEILVFLTDGTRLTARIIGADEKTDLAVLKVDTERKLPFVEFGESDDAEVGDWVMAIGNPFGLGGSVTLGIVSARNRDIESGPYDSFIQTDASINQGNSGGPLFDMEGKVVGINTAIIAAGGSSLGIGFAVPGNLAKPVIDQLVEYGETRRGWLGVGIQDVTDDIAASLGRANTRGALVIDVTAGGPSQGVLKDGDLILEFDGKPIERMRDLPRVVAETMVGKAVQVLVLRGGAEQVVDVTLGRLEVGETMTANADTAPETPTPDATTPSELPAGPAPGLPELLGFDAAPITDELRKQYSLPDGVDGVVVISVEQGTDAYEKGFLTGLIIVEINQQPITTVADITQKVSEAKESGRPAVLFKVTDQSSSSRFIAVRFRQP